MDYFEIENLIPSEHASNYSVVVNELIDQTLNKSIGYSMARIPPFQGENADEPKSVLSIKKYSNGTIERELIISGKYDTVFPIISKNIENQNKIRRDVAALRNLNDGWDGLDGKAPLNPVIEDALEFLEYWSFNVLTPEVELAADGSISLQIYDTERYALGGVRFFKDHKGVYSVVNRKTPIDFGSFKSNVIKEIIKSERKFRESVLDVKRKS